jgi:Ca2+-binding RTX toxin-like protein
MSEKRYKFTVEGGQVVGVIELDDGREKTKSLTEANKSFEANPDGSVSIVEVYSTFTETKLFRDVIATEAADGIYDLVSESKRFADGTTLVEDSGRGSDDGPGDDNSPRVRRVGTGGDDSLKGTGRDDSIEGGDGDDRISGNGGDDSCTGGNGEDTFVLAKPKNSASLTIADFASADDQIELDDRFFKGVIASNLAESLVFDDSASEADDRLIAKAVSSGFEIYYDRDGSGKKAAVLVATIVGMLEDSDFSIV